MPASDEVIAIGHIVGCVSEYHDCGCLHQTKSSPSGISLDVSVSITTVLSHPEVI
jgi:hypothetical protein